MKKITFILALFSLLFAACNFSGSDGKFSGETTTMEVSVYDIMSGLLFEEYDGTVSSGTVGSDQTVEIMENVYTISLEMVGEVPASIKIPEPITGTKLSDFENKSFVFTEIPVGTQLQFKLLVSDLGGELFEGTSDVVTITPAMQTVSIPMNKVYEYLPLYSKGNGYNLTMKNLKNKNDTVAFRNNASIISFTTDDESNLYALEDYDDFYCLVRYSPKSGYVKGEKIANINSYGGLKQSLVYDKTNGSIYVLQFSDGGIFLSEQKNAKTAKTINIDDENTLATYSFNFDWQELYAFTVFNDKFYVIKQNLVVNSVIETYEYFLEKYSLSVLMAGEESLNGGSVSAGEPEKRLQLTETTFNEDKEVEKDLVSTLLDSVQLYDKDYLLFNDMGVNENGIYILCSEYNSKNESAPIISRGCVIVVGADMEMASCKTAGFANSKMYFADSQATGFYTIGPKSINPAADGCGFFGPERIFAIKEKELVFADNGIWPTRDNYGAGQRSENHIVKLNLDTMTWVAEEVESNFTNKSLELLSSQFDDGEWVD